MRSHRSSLVGALLGASWLLAAHARDDLTPLLAAARIGNHDAAIALLREGADVRAVEADGTSALHWAADSGDAELVRALLAAGADVNAANRYGMTPLQAAAVEADPDVVGALLAAGADARAVLPEGETLVRCEDYQRIFQLFGFAEGID